ncbi:uncharacterized protein Z520_12068 [Fonsecaea multimorphosa CBS 102226]|uniref:Enoyl reductase (ER) domain-containing protein n=1 Tax=Fonsecaea multimorphosa CBS 102226 TaxID=1442371 RepID=A0A0D2JGA1_9EURO|nr:uncharacterized protein Z520_12068 [Fonsecaea multimorphosa CBS 102226]KIX92187.1 hypothetical protein Z520_12068 [Fonsecaea multimorphosa CBS 102226]OAL17563.1 hypothetical protein AYO22_11481 [Fonsecaea multimorphosa]
MFQQTNPAFEIPKEGWGGVVKNEGPDFYIEVEKVPVPEVGPNDVLIKLNCTGLCLTDVHCMLNDWGTPKMSASGIKCAGHEGAGVIVKVGERVTSYKVGQRAGIKPVLDVCHICEYCRSGRETYCQKAVLAGGHADGSYKQYIISPERYTTIIPDGVPDYIAGPAMCSASTIYTAIKNSEVRPGEWAVFPGGGGGVGIQGVQLAVAMGIRPVVVDTGKEREELAKKYGAEYFVDFKEVEDPVKKVIELTEGGGHVCFVTAVQSYPVALDYLGSRVGAKVMCIGIPAAGKFNLDIPPATLIYKGQSVMGTFVSSLVDIDETLAFACRGKLHLEPTVVGLSKWNESIQKLKNGQVAGRIVVDFNLP